MAKSRTRKVRRIKKDIISELPENIQETILCFLPIRDAMRTSILSKKWRHSWTVIPHLIFDYQFFRSMRGLRGNIIQCHNDSEENMHKYFSAINKALHLHKGPILKFFLTYPLGHYDDRTIHDHICQWMLLLSKKGIKQLFLENSDFREITAPDFSSLNLPHLRLTTVQFPSTPAFGEFTYLTNLELEYAANVGQSIFHCPVLEKLTLIYCKGLCRTNFRAPNLKCMFEISNKITLDGIENLTEYCFGLSSKYKPQRKTSNLVKFLDSLHNIEKISVGICFIMYLAEEGFPDRLSKPMPYLKSLNIFFINFTNLSEVSWLHCLIRSAPNLCKLHISASRRCDAVEGNLENDWVEGYEDCTIDKLEIVIFSFFRALRAELELVKFILAHSPLLKTMFIHYRCDIKKDVAVTMTEKMLQYSKASSRAQIRLCTEKMLQYSNASSRAQISLAQEHPVKYYDLGSLS